MSHHDLMNQLEQAMVAYGLEVPDIGSRKFTRFPGAGRKRSDKSAWIMTHSDGRGFTFGDFRTGDECTVREKEQNDIDPALAAKRRRLREEAIAMKDAQMRADWDKAAGKAQWMLGKSEPLPIDHPYLVNKRIPVMGTRLWKDSILIPVLSVSGDMRGLQFIKEDGQKFFLTDTRMDGSQYRIGTFNPGDNLIIAESFGTGATVHLLTDKCVCVAFNAGNIGNVCGALRGVLGQDQPLRIARDDDWETEGNPGKRYADKAALEHNAIVYEPEFPNDHQGMSDFNDIYCRIYQDESHDERVEELEELNKRYPK